MKVIAVSNYKGGCAKTTTAVNLAYNMAAEEGKRVLLIDATRRAMRVISCGNTIRTRTRCTDYTAEKR